MMRRFFVLVLLVTSCTVYSLDIVLQSYLPSIAGFAAGKLTVFNWFKGDGKDTERFSMPALEIKFAAASIVNMIVLSPIGAFTFVTEDNDFTRIASFNASIGLGIGGISA